MKDITKEILQELHTQKKQDAKANAKEVMEDCECKRCSYKWTPRKKRLPVFCPRCASKYWNIEKTWLVCAICGHGWWQKTKCVPQRCSRCHCKNWNNEYVHELNRKIYWLEDRIKEKAIT